ncbi:MAG: amidotransferase 1, exosortase A system-associated [Gammaproteobacteria bacterium]|nr:amidotransferase 1, exosortase A system-associated [Gammaproteobacteria bacterium]
MCGIAGIFDTRGLRPIDRPLLERMNQAQFHRGPDEGGTFIAPGIGLAHRRLSIIDVSTGQQPLFNQDRSICIVFNGEIYNFQQVRTDLQALGYAFQTHSDTEVIVQAWAAWGEDCVRKLRGMFAFAIWDTRQEKLFIARDRLGIKPLYFATLDDGQFLFGSELKVLATHPGLARRLDPLAVEDYFALGYIPEPRTIYRNVFKLLPGYTLTLSRQSAVPEPHQYWDISLHPGATKPADVEQELIARLKDAVGSHLMAEVPLGAFLSGGVDSSAVVAMMAQLQSTPVNTCAIGFNEKAFNETEFAQQVADRYHTNHFMKVVGTDDFDLIDQLALLYDEPFADSSAIPTHRVCQLARERVTVALSGDGGDELFAGYRRYRWHMNEERLRGAFPAGLRKPLFGFLGSIYPKADWAPKFLRAKTTFQALARDSVEGYFHNFSILTDGLRGQLYSESFKRELAGYRAIEVFKRYAANAPAEDPLSLVQYLDMKTYLVGDILTKVDRASMAHALEVRVPILDHEFMEWGSSLPHDVKLKGQTGKYIFKKALEPHLPNDVLYRPKMGFAVPLAQWFRGPLKQRVKDSLLGAAMADSGLFDMGFVGQLVEEHQSGRRDHSAALWSLLMFESFQRQCLQQAA